MDEVIRVAQVLNRLDYGGIEAVVLNYYRHIDRSKVQFDFFFSRQSVVPCREELERLGARLYLLPPVSDALAYQKELGNIFRRNQYAIVHAHLSTLSVFALFAAWCSGVPVRICHNHSTAHWEEGKRTAAKYALRPLAKLFATDYFACGEKAGRWLYGNRCFDNGCVYIMKNAIEEKRFAYDAQARAQLRKALGISENAFVLGHIGRFAAQKNHAFLLQVFRELRLQQPTAQLVLVGEGELREDIYRQVCKWGLEKVVHFVGACGDAARYYSVMDSFCLPSLYEGLPVVALEAQANGLPCLFSSYVTKECGVTDDVKWLPLEEPKKWASTVLAMKRQPICTFPASYHIEEAAGELQAFYCAKANEKFAVSM